MKEPVRRCLNTIGWIVVLCFLFLPSLGAADWVGFELFDTPDDAGHSLTVAWDRQSFEGEGVSYRLSVAPAADGPWKTLIEAPCDKLWALEYPEIFGHPEDPQARHAFKFASAPPPAEVVARLREKAEIERVAAGDTLQAVQEDLRAAGDEYTAFIAGLTPLKQRMDAAEGDARLRASRDVEAYLRRDNQLAALYSRHENATRTLARLENWTPPESTRLETGHPYHLRLSVIGGVQDGLQATRVQAPVGNWINSNKLNNLFIALLMAVLILFYTWRARKNPEQIFVRRIAGLEAVDEAIGRATEMGKPIFFVHGLATVATISTVAAINILGKIAEKVAEYGTEFKVTNRDPVVLAVSQEVVKEAYLRAGRPDLYNEDHVFYVSQDQFSYATGVEGMFLRERPASNFFFGYYYAEALLLTETGSHIGAIQIAGTDSYTQLPFFITTCDYTLMGEELYAASAYLSRDPKLLASLKAQDLTKGVLIAVATLGVLLSSLGWMWIYYLTESF